MKQLGVGQQVGQVMQLACAEVMADAGAAQPRMLIAL